MKIKLSPLKIFTTPETKAGSEENLISMGIYPNVYHPNQFFFPPVFFLTLHSIEKKEENVYRKVICERCLSFIRGKSLPIRTDIRILNIV